MADPDPITLNIRAVMALRGAYVKWRAELGALLQSNVPIERWAREAIAGAVLNETSLGPRLNLAIQDNDRRRAESIENKLCWMEVGRWINTKIDSGQKPADALYNASQKYNISEETCRKAKQYQKSAVEWIGKALVTPAGEPLGYDMLESIYHHIHAKPQDRAFLQMNAALLAVLDQPTEVGLVDPSSAVS